MRGAGFIAIGVAAGFAIATLIFHGSNSGKPAAGLPESASLRNASGTKSTAGEAKAAPPPLDKSRVRVAELPAVPLIRRTDGSVDHGAVQTKQRLLAAGITPDRADWLMQRHEELKAAQLQMSKELAGKPFEEQREMLRYLVDADLALREEVGDAEYATFRDASVRPIGTPILGVIPDSNAARAGLKQGDEIIQYGGKHVYSYFDLLDMASKNKSSAPTFLEVRRDGQTFQVLLPAGELGIQPDTYPQALTRLMLFPVQERLKAQKLEMERRNASSPAVQK
jgi:hypothetical protein